MARLLVCLLLVVCRLTAATQPNVVVLLADDAGWGDYSFNGNRQVATPNIDAIAKGGAHFDRFFVQPVCSPTRSEFLTGRYHRRLGVYGVSTGQERMNPDEKTFADSFKAAGYVTGIFGKWHNGSQWPYHPLARGFDTFWGYTSGHWGEYFDAPLEHNGVMKKSQGYVVDVLTDKALQFIERNKGKPFVCYVPFTTPHSPWSAPKEDWARFKDKSITQTATQAKQEKADETRCALAMVENQDRNVGRILAKLKELNLENDTIVVYFSDNGPNGHRWTGGMKGTKGTTDEGGVRSPLFIRWPGRIEAGTQVKPIAGAIDLAPTLHALAGVKRVGDKPLDGRDLSPLLKRGHDADWAPRQIFQTWGSSISVRTETHRLDNAGNLFDMIADPGQTTPAQAKQPELAQELAAAVAAWRKEMGIAAPAGGKGKAKGGNGPGNAVDPRPISVGYREFPITMLPARDGEPRGEMRRSSAAPNSSYFVNWTKPTDAAVWNIEVVNAGTYVVTLDYACAAADVGSSLELSFEGTLLKGKLTEAFDSPLKHEQDTIPRPHGESVMRDFKTMTLGEVRLEPGKGELRLRATAIPGKSVMELRRVTLTLK
ncbi:MAG: N-acetylgalactosamine 6-sulfate sulfatase [Verrucomicrobia bacterium]|nr:N-acetylgalactosamine 6-sulfate sulfatase [Verrucomicrobiota bacterium]